MQLGFCLRPQFSMPAQNFLSLQREKRERDIGRAWDLERERDRYNFYWVLSFLVQCASFFLSLIANSNLVLIPLLFHFLYLVSSKSLLFSFIRVLLLHYNSSFYQFVYLFQSFLIFFFLLFFFWNSIPLTYFHLHLGFHFSIWITN